MVGLLFLAAAALAGDPSVCQAPPAGGTASEHYAHGLCLALAHGDPRAQYSSYERALELDPHHQGAIGAAACLAASRDLPEAGALWARIEPLALTERTALGCRARLAMSMQAWRRARADLDAALDLTADDVSLRLDRAVVAYCTGDQARVLEDAAFVIPRARSHERLRGCWLAASLHGQAGQADEELALLRRADCQADRSASQEPVEVLRTRLEDQLDKTFGGSWKPGCP